MPTFKEAKSWIREAARELGAQVNGREAQALAGAYLTTLDTDPQLRQSALSYADPTGERAVKAWFRGITT
ncbi:hypothetical protein [Nesterenkonia jeotgali]|uniref:Uncharacterized protein n=1 Tax=Nesterenkonia jeotgali TaxID=317018 RepID=A0A839FUF6_9MICC|nr:hypothetical protein [Nesterenkonia jeotgali]MBA8920417.1 hypothetical protein [Nesterenkonia jeotgali]